MSGRIFMRALQATAQACAQKWGRQAGDKSISYLTRWAQQRGLSNRSYDLDSLKSELTRMYQEGKFNKSEWQQIKTRLAQAVKSRRGSGGS
ncbi:MAG: hypothetical protein ACLFRL_02075 [Desulfohalobiaceae bacterium]